MDEITITCPKCGAEGQTIAFTYDGAHIRCSRCRMKMFFSGNFEKMTPEEIAEAVTETAKGIYALSGGSDETWKRPS